MNARFYLILGFILLSWHIAFGQNTIDVGVNFMPSYVKSTNSFSSDNNRAHHLDLVIEEPLNNRLALYNAIGVNWVNTNTSLIDVDILLPNDFGKSRRISLSMGIKTYSSKKRQLLGFFGGLYANYSREVNAERSFRPISINSIGIRPEIGYKFLIANSLIAEFGTGIILSHGIDESFSFANFNHPYLLAKIGYRFNKKTK